MREMNLTRRRTVQGVGAIGVASIAGSAVVSADGDVSSAAQQQEGSALRVAHASPDTPSVEVRLAETGGAGGGAGTPAAGDGTPTEGEDDPLVEDIGFREVSDYNEVDPGTYLLQVVATEETGLIEEIFGDEGEERVVFEDEVEIEEGTTYTAVAYGELARADVGEGGAGGGATGETPVGGETPGGDGATGGGEGTPTADGTPTGEGTAGAGEVLVEGLSFGEHQYVEVEAGDHTLQFRESQAAGDDTLGGDTTPEADETTPGGGTTPVDGGTTPGGAGGGDDRAFQVAVLEDELSVTGDGTAGGDVGTPTGEETPGGGGGTPGGEELSRLRVFHAVPDVDAMDVVSVEADGDGGLLDGGEETPDDQTPVEETPGGDTGGGGETEGDRVQQAEISPEGGVVYSGFALGYFDPEAGATGDGGAGGDNATDGDGGDDGITEDPEGETFEFVTVEDASDGERSDGGTGGGILPSMAAPEASSD